MYDYGARNYDAALGRWMNVDPLAEQAVNWTPYRYSFNNPVMYTDPTGLFETKFGAWWHKLWNGDDSSSDIMYNEERKEYYYTNHSSYEDESGNQGLNMSFIYNSIKGDAGRLVFEIEGKASIGLQAGLTVPFGSVEAGAITADIGSLGYSNQNPDQPIAKWGDGTGHNFIGGSLNAPYFKNIAISGKLDYVTKDMTPSGQLLDYYPNHGNLQTEWGIGPKRSVKMAKMTQLTNKTSLGGGDLGGKIGTVSGSNNHVLDLSVGVKAIIGIDVSLKIGLTGKTRK